MKRKLLLLLFLLVVFVYKASANIFTDTAPTVNVLQLTNGIRLHYISKGSGPAMVFVPGSISDYTYWNDEAAYFSRYYHVIAYSRRYDYPNHNLTRPGYSAKSDAEDLAELIKNLKLGNVIIVGNSYGALAALFLAIHHPEMVNKMILAEPFAIGLLDNLNGAEAAKGKILRKDMEQRMAIPMRKAFKAGNTEMGLQIYINYVYNSRNAWKKLPFAEKHEALRNSYEWEVMMTAGVLFPPINTKDLAQIKTPVLLLSGERSFRFYNLTDAGLHRTLPNNSQVIFEGSNDKLWYQRSPQCRQFALSFLKGAIANHSLIRQK